MTAYRNAVLKISARFEGLEFHHIPRDSNQALDILARIATKQDKVPDNTFLEWLFKPSCRRTTPMGSKRPLYDSAGGSRCTKSRPNDQREGFLPRFGPLGSVKPYSYLVILWMFHSDLGSASC